MSWRSEGIRYRKNEVFLDVIESLNLLVSANGNVLRSEILGSVKMKCYLSGMPELRLGLNDKVMFEATGRATRGKSIEMEDVKFHQCVRLSRFENDRTISFIPPDGEFELMSYRLNTQVKPLIWVECVVESHSGSRIEYMLKVRRGRHSFDPHGGHATNTRQAKAQFKRRSTANNVSISIPVPDDADSPRFRTNIGTVHYAPETSSIVWKIKQFGGGKEFLMRAELGLPSVRGDDDKGGGMMGGFGGSMGGIGGGGKSKRPIQVKFEIPYFTTSGIQVRYLKIIEHKVRLSPSQSRGHPHTTIPGPEAQSPGRDPSRRGRGGAVRKLSTSRVLFCLPEAASGALSCLALCCRRNRLAAASLCIACMGGQVGRNSITTSSSSFLLRFLWHGACRYPGNVADQTAL